MQLGLIALASLPMCEVNTLTGQGLAWDSNDPSSALPAASRLEDF